jgi:5'-deoxynucleotidase YfbR-like HD superfamily hydrolase
MNDIQKAYIITFTGRKFNLLEPRLEDINFEDIAHSQAMSCRWTGHSKHHYSIAQHVYYCSFLGPEENALWNLLHDGSESYIGDMNRPLKHYTDAGEAYRKVEWPIQNLVYNAAGLFAPYDVNGAMIEPATVKIADEAMLYCEQEQLLPPVAFETSNPFGRSRAANIVIEEWSPKQAERMFMDRYESLSRRRIN